MSNLENIFKVKLILALLISIFSADKVFACSEESFKINDARVMIVPYHESCTYVGTGKYEDRYEMKFDCEEGAGFYDQDRKLGNYQSSYSWLDYNDYQYRWNRDLVKYDQPYRAYWIVYNRVEEFMNWWWTSPPRSAWNEHSNNKFLIWCFDGLGHFPGSPGDEDDDQECPNLNITIRGTLLPARRGMARVSGDWCN